MIKYLLLGLFAVVCFTGCGKSNFQSNTLDNSVSIASAGGGKDYSSSPGSCQSFSKGRWCAVDWGQYVEWDCGCSMNTSEGWVPQAENCWHRLTHESCEISSSPS